MQSQAYITPALGKAGTISRLNPVPQHFPVVAEGSNVVAGKFLFAGTDAEKQVKGLGVANQAPVGLAIFEKYQPDLGGSTLAINEGEQLACLVRGCAYIIAPSAATKGLHVAVNPTTGAIELFTPTAATGAVTGSLTSGAVTGTVSDSTVTGSVTNTAVTGTAAISATGQSSGYVDTGWIVETGGASGAVIEIKNV